MDGWLVGWMDGWMDSGVARGGQVGESAPGRQGMGAPK